MAKGFCTPPIEVETLTNIIQANEYMTVSAGGCYKYGKVIQIDITITVGNNAISAWNEIPIFNSSIDIAGYAQGYSPKFANSISPGQAIFFNGNKVVFSASVPAASSFRVYLTALTN